MQLKNSTILITGATSGIGLEFVKQLIQHGVADIIVTGRNADKLKQVKNQFPQVHIFQSDVSNPEDIRQLYAQVIQLFPQLNILINNAGIMRNLDLQDTKMELENITQETDINLLGTIRMVHQFLPHLKLKQTAAIVNVSSGLAFVPFSASPIYSAAKSGVHAYTQVLRLQLKKTNVKVFELAPPSTETPLLDAFPELDAESGGPVMKVAKLVQVAIKGILSDTYEIKPGLSKALKLMGRIAPNFLLNLFDKTIEKGKTKKRKLQLAQQSL